MAAQQLAASAKNLVTVRQRESATEMRVTETEKRTGTRTEIAKGKGTGTEIMTVTVIGTVNATATGIENATGGNPFVMVRHDLIFTKSSNVPIPNSCSRT